MAAPIPEDLAPTPIVESNHPEVVAFARKHGDEHGDPRAVAVQLYYAVRDGFRYDPYNAGAEVETLRASSVLAAGRGWCVSKAVLLSAACRAVGIPKRIFFWRAYLRPMLSIAPFGAALAIGVNAFVKPGPAVTMATPGRRVSRP